MQRAIHTPRTQMSAIRRNPDCTRSSSIPSFQTIYATKSSPKSRPFICGCGLRHGAMALLAQFCVITPGALSHYPDPFGAFHATTPPYNATPWRNSSLSRLHVSHLSKRHQENHSHMPPTPFHGSLRVHWNHESCRHGSLCRSIEID